MFADLIPGLSGPVLNSMGHKGDDVQEPAGHQDLGTTPRYMHLSPAALDGAIRLLEADDFGSARGERVETEDREIAKSNSV